MTRPWGPFGLLKEEAGQDEECAKVCSEGFAGQEKRTKSHRARKGPLLGQCLPAITDMSVLPHLCIWLAGGFRAFSVDSNFLPYFFLVLDRKLVWNEVSPILELRQSWNSGRAGTHGNPLVGVTGEPPGHQLIRVGVVVFERKERERESLTMYHRLAWNSLCDTEERREGEEGVEEGRTQQMSVLVWYMAVLYVIKTTLLVKKIHYIYWDKKMSPPH